VEFVFNKLDEDGNNQVEFEEFRKWLEMNEVRMS
jgi:calcium-dependent protein kinase